MNIESILTHYDEPHRHYHNRKHIEYMFNTAEKEGVKIKEGDPLWYAIVYHDIVYKPTRKDNEEKSANIYKDYFWKLFKKESGKIQFGAFITPNFTLESLPQRLIMLTKTHRIDNTMWFDDQLQIAENLIDLDLAILGDTWEVYQEYVYNVRKEYSHLTDEEWKEGRGKWLSDMMDRKSIYYTDWGKKREDQAKHNLTHEFNILISTKDKKILC